MAGRARLGRWLTAGACLAWAFGSLAGASTGDVVRSAAAPGPVVLRVLQLNLCNSGIAGCYTGRAVAQAATVIRTLRPDVVALNEVCRPDVAVLTRTLEAADGSRASSAFRPAIDRRTGAAVRCTTGQPYGIGLLVRLRSADTELATRDGGVYPMQNSGDPEERVWLCLHPAGAVDACTTHLANARPAVALAQCRYLMATAVPRSQRAGPADSVVVAGDFNLRADRSPAPAACLPPGFTDVDDGGTQFVVAGGGLRVGSAATMGMRGTTDHPGLLVALVAARAGRTR